MLDDRATWAHNAAAMKHAGLILAIVGAGFFAAACESSPPEPKPSTNNAKRAEELTPAATNTAPKPAPLPEPPRLAAKPVASVVSSPDDPLKGKWSLDDALHGVSGHGPLYASIDTELGKIDCKLLDEKAPLTVANFIGLARGTRPWKDPTGAWVKKPAYDGTVFHRIIRGFMIQGGDAKGNGTGEPGYIIPDEIWEGGRHDRPGLLCMANRGPNTNGAQFFITDDAAPHLDGGYTIFGECSPLDTIHKIAAVEVVRDRPKSPPKIKSIKIRRGK